MNTPTFQRLYDAELARTGSPTRAFSRALLIQSFLNALIQQDKVGDQRFARSTYKRHKLSLRRAGIAPVETPEALAALVQDIGAPTDAVSLTRLLWTLNTDEKRSLEKVMAAWKPFVAAAQALFVEESPVA